MMGLVLKPVSIPFGILPFMLKTNASYEGVYLNIDLPPSFLELVASSNPNGKVIGGIIIGKFANELEELELLLEELDKEDELELLDDKDDENELLELELKEELNELEDLEDDDEK